MSIPADFIERVRSSTDIVGLISQYVPLKVAGKSFKGLCPFHNEKTPSFHVNPERQIFHCFGCSEGGDAFKFLMLYDKLSFVESVERLAGRVGLQLPRSGGYRREEQDRSHLFRLNEEAARFFQKNLESSDLGKRTRSYLERRGFSEQTIQEFGLGVAPDEWSGLLDVLRRSGAKPEHIVQAGLAVPRKSGQGFYDRFRNRLMIPIRSESGKIVAFGGRILGEGEPKYLNSPESPIYNKSTLLYGFDHARDGIRKEGFAILMEGYMDCLQVYQAGIPQAVACCGTSLTGAHARLMRRYTEKVIVNFDSDPAGERAARRSIDLLLEEGFDVHVLTLPDGLDPDSFIRTRGSEAYREQLDRAGSIVDFLIQEASKRYDVHTPRGKSAFLNDVLPVIAKIPSRVERAGYVGPLAERAGISDTAVLEELRRQLEGRAVRFQPPVEAKQTGKVKVAERDLIRWVLNGTGESAILEEIVEEDLEGLETAPILRVMKELAPLGPLTMDKILEGLPTEDLRTSLRGIAVEPSPLGPRQSPRDCLNRLREERWMNKLTRLRAMQAKGVDDDNLTAEILSLARRIETLRRVETRA